jgi:CHAD domain-containing protein
VTAAAGGFALGAVARSRTSVGGIRVRRGSHSLAKVEVASIAVLDGQRTVRELYEIELEPLAAEAKELSRIEKALRKAGAKRADDATTTYRRAVDGAAPVEAPTTTPALEQLRAFFRDQYARILAHDPGVRLSANPEDLHQLRVAVRRLRSVLRTAGDVVEEAWAARLRDELSWLGDELGTARDLDVLLAHLREEVGRLEPTDRRALRPILNKLEREREAAQGRLLETLRGERYLGLLATLEGAVAAPPAGADGSLLDAARAEFGHLRKAMSKLGDDPTDDALHKARIRGKRARYAAELLEDDLGKPASQLIKRAKRFQDVAGEHQDAVVAEARIRKLAQEGRSKRGILAAGILVGRQRERRRHAAEALPGAWSRLDDAAAKAWN